MISSQQISPSPYASSTATNVDDERWHVVFGPNDMRVMTLEQLDDAYRLSLIDDSTQVWKAGMAHWAPLGIVAGVESAPVATITQTPPPRPAATQPLPQASAWAPQPQLSPQPAAAVPAWAAQPQLSLQPPVLAPPRSAALSADLRQLARAGRQPWRWLFVVLLGGAAAVAAFRNDTLRAGAAGMGAAGPYGNFEQTVTGKPGFGTPRAVEELVANTSARVPDVRAARATRLKAEASAAANAAANAAATAAAATAAAPEAPSVAAPSTQESATAVRAGNRATADKASGKASSHEAEAGPFAAPSGAKGKKQKLDDHDPLNPNL